MSLPVSEINSLVIKAPAKVRQRGEAIFAQCGSGDEVEEWARITVEKEGPRSRVLHVPSQSFDDSYVVGFSWTASGLSTRCDCPAAAEAPICKHMVAAALFLLKNAAEKEAEGNPVSGKSLPPAQKRPELTLKMTRVGKAGTFIREMVGWYPNLNAAALAKLTPLEAQGQEGRWAFHYNSGKQTHHYPAIHYDRRETFELYCTCHAAGMCLHLRTALNWIRDRHGDACFGKFRNFDVEKAAFLARYGLTPDDPLADEFIFSADNYDHFTGRPPQWILSQGDVSQRLQNLAVHLELPAPPAPPDLQDLKLPKDVVPAVVFLTRPTAVPLDLELIVGDVVNGKFSRIQWNNPAHTDGLRRATSEAVFEALQQLSTEGLNARLRDMGSHARLPADAQHLHHYGNVLPTLRRHYHDHLQKLWPWLSSLSADARFETDVTRLSNNAFQPLALDPRPLHGSLELGEEGRFLLLKTVWKTGSGEVIPQTLTLQGDVLLRDGQGTWWLPATQKDLRLTAVFPHGRLLMPRTALEEVLRTTVAQLSQAYEVAIDPALQPRAATLPVAPELHLAEVGKKHLAIIPRFRYGNEVFSYEEKPLPMLVKGADGLLENLTRDTDGEKAFMEKITALHPEFEAQRGRAFYLLSFPKALEQSWYQHTLAALEAEGIPVTGVADLEHFRYSIHPAEVHVTEAGAGNREIDWFDLKIEISFGDQHVGLKDVRRALLNGQAGVRLPDGSIGLLPADFVARYGPLLRLGSETKSGALRVSKLHFTLIDQLHEAALSADLRAELEEKKQRLAHVEAVQTDPVPAAIRATLRPYQLGGYQWLQVLETLGWGGCLADDMGLGKTLQTITFLQWLAAKHPGAQSLVVCPTSLIYNWQAELEKFAPGLRYHIHYGPGRVWNADAPPDADVVITSYGAVRSDIEVLSQVRWHYVILDESLAIKNPDAQTTRAVQLLPARNRICLSGTPLQNNTFDLYAQFQFLNPGLLGSRETFRTDFANPIDKHGEEGPRALLRKMLSPFMLRRTKAQVAPELPDKTEMTLWCEMDEAQRAVYDEYRRYYRDSLLQRIDAEGMAASTIQVLEALLRLRQLCDHPALVKNQSVQTNESVKIEELRREILENVGGKKVLVFSQFTGMLALIAADFDREGIPFTYLDGKTPAADRAAAVEAFQSDPAVQVFLISLKAGGVGLNLTAAEYVYLVDPWWNPAVEAQAIDRTHRIGQRNKVMAYRMICKDTVEEKVLLLQARKKALADGLVTEDAGFVKKLTREDVAFLLG